MVVDGSAAMLAQVRGARTVRGDFAALDLGKRFTVVLVASTAAMTALLDTHADLDAPTTRGPAYRCRRSGPPGPPRRTSQASVMCVNIASAAPFGSWAAMRS